MFDVSSVGPLRVEFNSPVDLEQIKKDNPNVQLGGRFRPKDCEARQKVAIIIPFRKRDEHLKFWLYYLHPILQRQQLDYGVYVINQVQCDVTVMSSDCSMCGCLPGREALMTAPIHVHYRIYTWLRGLCVRPLRGSEQCPGSFCSQPTNSPTQNPENHNELFLFFSFVLMKVKRCNMFISFRAPTGQGQASCFPLFLVFMLS